MASRSARRRAAAIMPAERSTATTVPVGPTRAASEKAGWPEPQATSRTRMPGASAAASQHHAIMGAKFREYHGNQRSHPSATALHWVL